MPDGRRHNTGEAGREAVIRKRAAERAARHAAAINAYAEVIAAEAPELTGEQIGKLAAIFGRCGEAADVVRRSAAYYAEADEATAGDAA